MKEEKEEVGKCYSAEEDGAVVCIFLGCGTTCHTVHLSLRGSREKGRRFKIPLPEIFRHIFYSQVLTS